MKRRIGLILAFVIVIGLIALTTLRLPVPADKLALISAEGEGSRIVVKGQITAPLRFVSGIEYENTAEGRTKIRVLSTFRLKGQKEFTVNVNNSEGAVKEIVFYDKSGGEKSVWEGKILPQQTPAATPIPDAALSAAPTPSSE
ncbi:MAG: hypothetical protein HFI90_08420 [Clostridia bacterium]|nr:hypothetical protein [Clostridia bacterium]